MGSCSSSSAKEESLRALGNRLVSKLQLADYSAHGFRWNEQKGGHDVVAPPDAGETLMYPEFPNFRYSGHTVSDARDELRLMYSGTLREAAEAARSGRSSIRIPSCGEEFAGKMLDVLPQLTFEAIAGAFVSLEPQAQQALLDDGCKLQLCFYFGSQRALYAAAQKSFLQQ
eukprot:TRINITY_DN854_c0_g1_i2.p1 TRINITY_DN854_c0_g1~~TRINITY_DN854_c0_g1_i2.p1  ORF type:complete len:191 (+),score=65.50 TRINITY_DN854_c0_g1_i2:63-575(+)